MQGAVFKLLFGNLIMLDNNNILEPKYLFIACTFGGIRNIVMKVFTQCFYLFAVDLLQVFLSLSYIYNENGKGIDLESVY